MNHDNPQRGSSTALIVIVIAIIVLGAGILYFSSPKTRPQATTTPLVSVGSSPAARTSGLPPTSGTTLTYSGAVLAGTTAPLLDFNAADFQTAITANKTIVLYFYADWCPICREEFPKMQAAFNELTTDQVVGFRVNFNDDATDATEQALARQHGVAYQHTKVIVKNGQQILKSPETWEKSRYLTEITKALAN